MPEGVEEKIDVVEAPAVEEPQANDPENEASIPVEEPSKEKTEPDIMVELERERDRVALLQEKLEHETKARAEARREAKEWKRRADEAVRVSGEPDDKTADIDTVLERKLYERDLRAYLQESGIEKDDVAILETYAKKLRRAGLATGNVENDAEKAKAMYTMDKNRSSKGIPSPSSVAGGARTDTASSIPRSVMEMRKELKLDPEDVKKYGLNPEIEL